uniref:Isoleucyl-tRNA synthetase n=2 Tax=Podospora anserina (strain S / ATCC MYA-4624 / DSM 980 / FGSC 10383) TaxID=515849 RepID=A0A090CXL8_PODAN|nr:Putative isoleucyl-tRNA synthetase [Podospora anserina S mat+]
MSGHSCYTGCQPDPFNHETATPIPSLWTGFPSPVEKAALRAFRISFAAQPSLSARNVRLGFKMARSDFAGSTLGSEPSSPTSPMGSDRSRGSSAPTTVTAASVDPLINPTQAIDGAEHQPTPSLASIAIEEPIPAEGWLDLARLMTKTPDFAAFSRFHDLHIKNLFKQFLKIRELRECLKGYGITHNMRQLVKWLQDEDHGNMTVQGVGSEIWGDQQKKPEPPPLRQQFMNLISFWNKTEPPTRADLVAPRWRKDVDGLTRWLAEELIPFREAVKNPHKREADDSESTAGQEGSEKTSTNHVEDADKEAQKRRSRTDNVRAYSGDTLLKLTYRGATLVACMLPIVAILCLSIVPNLYHKLAMITCFTVLFAIAVMCMTEGTRVQVFTATSAFLAVLVVFVPVQSS